MSELESNVTKAVMTDKTGQDLVAAITRLNNDYLSINTNSYDPNSTLAEVKNARVINGVTYPTLGEM